MELNRSGVLPDLRPIAYITGLFLVILAGSMLLPAFLTLLHGHDQWRGFTQAALATMVAGAVMAGAFRRADFNLIPRQMFLLTITVWLVITAFAALPLLLVEHISYTDAFFETMSGLTTTGSTVLTDLTHQPEGILLWRSLLQWIGGVGFIVMGVAVLPFLRVGGMRLFQTESSDWSAKSLPRTKDVAKHVLLVYLLLTLACTVAYLGSGMNGFQAVNHAMTTLSTGGYSTADASFGQFDATAQWSASLFMLLGGLPFLIYLHAVQQGPRVFWQDSQVRAYLTLLALCSLAIGLWLWLTAGQAPMTALRIATFHVISVVTTTGYATEDYSTWGSFAMIAFFYLTFIGGCSGSSAGGVKIFRFQIALVMLGNQMRLLLHPRAVFRELYNGRQITDDITRSVVAFSFFFATTIALVALGLSALGLDPITSLSGAATAVANVGPGLGPSIGPAGNFAAVPDAGKWLLCAGMLMGRLEILTVLVLFTPGFWQR